MQKNDILSPNLATGTHATLRPYQKGFIIYILHLLYESKGRKEAERDCRRGPLGCALLSKLSTRNRQQLQATRQFSVGFAARLWLMPTQVACVPLL
jgi:hypothetical protein